MDAGISFNGLEHLQLTGAYGGAAGSGGPCSDFPEALPRRAADRPGLYSMQAFHLYWDFDAGRYGMRDPLVVAPDGSQVPCAAPGGLDYDTRYYCVVTLDDGTYSARVASEEDASGFDADDYDGLWKVLLFKVPPEDYLEALDDDESGFQFHAGAVVLGGGGGGGGGEECRCHWKDPDDEDESSGGSGEGTY